MRKYSFCPKVSSGASARSDTLIEFLDEAVRKDSSVARAKSMMQGALGHNFFLHDYFALKRMQSSRRKTPMSKLLPLKQLIAQNHKADHLHVASIVALVSVQPIATRGRSKHPRKRHSFDVVLINSSGKPQLLAALEA